MRRWIMAFVLLFLVGLIALELLYQACIDPVTRSIPLVRTAQSSLDVVVALVAATAGASLYVKLN